MKDKEIIDSEVYFDSEELRGKRVTESVRVLGDLQGVFGDGKAFSSMDLSQEIYRVASFLPVSEGTPGGLYIGITYLAPGKVGDEYFMTKGHFHKNPDSAEYYWGVKGKGMLILMDEGRNVWAERMCPGSLHYIPAGVAHRVANVGDTCLVFAASWPSDAGHDYETIAEKGFARRLLDVDGSPELV